MTKDTCIFCGEDFYWEEGSMCDICFTEVCADCVTKDDDGDMLCPDCIDEAKLDYEKPKLFASKIMKCTTCHHEWQVVDKKDQPNCDWCQAPGEISK